MTQIHHITYKPPWTVPLSGWQHKVVTHLQSYKATKTNELKARYFMQAVTYEYLRIACQLARIEEGNINK